MLGLPKPDPAAATHELNDYVFERAVKKHKDEGDSHGRIDLYKKNSFVLEAKQSRLKGAKKIPGQNDLFTADVPEGSRGRRGADRAWDVLMLNAKRQAEEYARALPTSHGWPPFILICDVGHCIEVYADFSGQGKNYTQFPDRQTFRIYLEDLRNDEVCERLRKIWLDPASLDPAQVSAKVTRNIAKRLAQVSLALEKQEYPAHDVAMFLMRCLFTMFAEDVGLLPEKSFKEVLQECEKNPDAFTHDVGQLWEAMDLGTWAHVLKTKVKKFNGEFFRNRAALPLGREEIGELRQAATHNWNEVDPSIFGTLLEQALDPDERDRLGAHYTPRAYVERLDDLPDPTLREISNEIYKSLQTGSHYLATFGSRTLIDRLIVLTVGDKGNFAKGLAALRDEGKISQHERDILEPVLQAGHAAAHRGWAPTKEQLAIILNTVEGLIYRLLVLPKLAEELEEAVPGKGSSAKAKAVEAISNVKVKIDAAPKDLRAIYDELASRLKSLGDDVTVHPQKHYMAFRRNRNFASVQIYNQKKVVRVYLNLDPDAVESNGLSIRDVRQIGHFGTGDLEITIKTKKDIDVAARLLKASYEAS